MTRIIKQKMNNYLRSLIMKRTGALHDIKFHDHQAIIKKMSMNYAVQTAKNGLLLPVSMN